MNRLRRNKPLIRRSSPSLSSLPLFCMRNIFQKPHRCWVIICSDFSFRYCEENLTPNFISASSMDVNCYLEEYLAVLGHHAMLWRKSSSTAHEQLFSKFLWTSCLVSGIQTPNSQIPNPASQTYEKQSVSDEKLQAITIIAVPNNDSHSMRDHVADKIIRIFSVVNFL